MVNIKQNQPTYRKMIEMDSNELEFYKIHSFDQIDQPSDLNIKKKQWNKIRTAVDKIYPKFKKE